MAEQASPGPGLILVAGLAWGLLVAGPAILPTSTLCTSRVITGIPNGAEFAFLFKSVSLADLSSSWLLMLAAMMLPLLGAPLHHVRVRSLPRHRLAATWAFIGAYLAVWLFAGLPLIAAALTIRMAMADPTMAFALAALMAMAWQATRWKRIALNRCHVRPPMSDRAAATRFGIQHGLWCVAGCAPLMIAAALAALLATPIMAVAAIWIWLERLEPSQAPGTGPVWPHRAWRAAAYHLRRVLARPRAAAQ